MSTREMSTTTTSAPVLEAAAQAFAEATANPPFLSDLPPAEGRKAVDEVQSGEIAKPDVDERVGSPSLVARPARSTVRIVKPRGRAGPLPVILYIHGAGWVFGDAHTHDRLVRELAVGDRRGRRLPRLRPLARSPLPGRRSSRTTPSRSGSSPRAPPRASTRSRLAVAGDSVGGNMAAALTLMAKERGGPTLAAQVLFYPVTDASFDTGSYHQFAEGYFLRRDGMQWFWDQYTTDPDAARRDHRLAAARDRSSSSPGCRRRSSSPPRPTSCATRARRTPTSCARPACLSPRPATRASSTTS